MYNVIALTEIKGYAMIQFAYMIKRLHGEGNFTIGKANFNFKMRDPSGPKYHIFAADSTLYKICTSDLEWYIFSEPE